MEVGIGSKQGAKGFEYENGYASIGICFFHCAYRRRGQDDIADIAKLDQKNVMVICRHESIIW